jgi:hypothetical protein
MPTAAEKRRMRRMEHLLGIVVPAVTRRVLDGKDPQPGWLPRRLLTVASGDVDVDAGCGAVWLLWRPWSSRSGTYTARVEHHDGQFRYTGAGSVRDGGALLDRDAPAGRSAAGEPGQVGMIEMGGYSGGVSAAWCLEHGGRSTDAPWVGASQLRLAAEVDHLLIGVQRRRIQVPDHGRVIVAWKSPTTRTGGIRPLIVAARRDGSELSRLGPADVMDTYTTVKLGVEPS